MLSLIDEAAFVEARRHGMHKWVTACFDRVDFKQPIRVGDTVSLYTRTEQEGTKSVSIEICVEVMRYDTNVTEEVTTAHVTMVSVDCDGNPIPFTEPGTL